VTNTTDQAEREQAKLKRAELKRAEDEARKIVRGGKATPAQVLDLVKVLSRERRFGLARKILQRVRNDPSLGADWELRLKVGHKLSLNTYKDPDLPSDKKLQDALEILQSFENLQTSTNQETLGQAGAIYKRRWELTAQQRDLETSLAYYYRGYLQGVGTDQGYTGINAAFALDLLADIESVSAGPIPLTTAEQRQSLAAEIRHKIIERVPGLADEPETAWLKNEWFFYATVGEAYFGLDDYPNARHWLGLAAGLPGVADWEKETTARQLAALLRIKQNREKRGGPPVTAQARAVLLEFLREDEAALDSVVRGKVGLALSGGGFRASLYHIGVLAKLAEFDLLRHVEYLSCVSGGSIVGAHFYLEVRKLLQEKDDKDITRDDYIEIVDRLVDDFYAGVKTNIRTRIAAEWWTNIKMIFCPGYSRTMRAGELYESKIYARVDDKEGKKPRWLNELKIKPFNKPDKPVREREFSPKDDNWHRFAKAPILVLNATSLNTGHNWQFTATWMGEPPAGIATKVDANSRLRRMYYTEAPEKHQTIRLGYAVAASASVPGIFEPLTLLDLYEPLPPPAMERPVVRLCDGGVFDNQGMSALLEQGCSVLLVSDASGQMADLDFPPNSVLGVPLRANSILQSRVRIAQYEDLDSRKRGALLKGLMFIHLKEDLDSTEVDWIDCQEPAEQRCRPPLTGYGVQRHVQRQLAAVRTDLDSFTEVEAYALMTSGYLMAGQALAEQGILGFSIEPPAEQQWKFLAIRPRMEQAGEKTPLLRQLRVANTRLFKVWYLIRYLQFLAGLLALVLLCLLGYAAYQWWSNKIVELTVGGAIFGLLMIGLSLAGLGFLTKLINYKKTVAEILVGIGMATFGFLVARLHLHVFDKLFLKQGSLKNLLER
jgi:predicted acylesterase/phospholipase RssA